MYSIHLAFLYIGAGFGFLSLGFSKIFPAVFSKQLNVEKLVQGWQPLQTNGNVYGNVCSQAEVSVGALSVE